MVCINVRFTLFCAPNPLTKLHLQVRHLETSNACMADDLLEKSAIIQHYVMNSNIGGIQWLCHILFM